MQNANFILQLFKVEKVFNFVCFLVDFENISAEVEN